MPNYLGDIIRERRLRDELTQDQYGARYSVTGPAIFKFEKGYVMPSLELWLKMTADIGLSTRRAVLLWAKCRLPAPYQDYIELQGVAAAENELEHARGNGEKLDYAQCETREQMRVLLARDKTLPRSLRDLLEDDELWALYKPTGPEINLLRDRFGPLGRGSKTTYREALRLVREFAHSV